MRNDLTAERLRYLMRYMPENGQFIRISRSGVGAHSLSERPAGTITRKGYREIRVDGKLYYAHRLAWLFMTSCWPSAFVDHIDLNKDNNSWYNLREATNSQNGANRSLYKNNVSGLKGVHQTEYGRYVAQIRKDGTVRYIGTYDTRELANAAYEKAALELHGEFARTS